MSSEDDNVRTDEYWIGVRDALRMVDSFNKWSIRNPGRAKSLEDFIHDGLIAAAKRCESCLRDKLGLSFVEGEDEDDEITFEEPMKLDDDDHEEDDDDDDDDDKPESSFEEPISHVEPDTFIPPSDDSDESSITLDHVERREDEQMEDLSIEGPPREFATDFELVEPTPLVVDEEVEPESFSEPEIEPEDVWSEPSVEEEVVPIPEPEEVLIEPSIEDEVEPDSEEVPDKPAFTWTEYEEAVSPSLEPEPLDPEVDIIPSEDEAVSIDEEDTVSEEPPEPPKEWSPYDEPSTPDEVESEEDTEAGFDKPEPEIEEDGEPVISEPPPPPPPPESEEDEEERKRRARRLFFGA